MTPEQRKKLGAYYTPEPVTNALCLWAIREPNDQILEPSFGGCNFLTSSMGVLRKLNNQTPLQNIHGFDIDTAAFQLLIEKEIELDNFILGDFLHSSKRDNDFMVNVIIGNPPYLPIHKLEIDYKEDLYNRFKKSDPKIPRRSSLWVYFIVHSFQYLLPGGRMAWVVPDSITFTDYGKHLLDELGKRFSEVQVLRTDERYFYDEGTHEKTAVLLCDGYLTNTSTVQIFEYDDLTEVLNAMLSNQRNNGSVLKSTEQRPFGFKWLTLGEIFVTRIGIVIGATKLLAFKKKDAFNSELYPRFLYPMITKGKTLKNLLINRKLLYQNDELPIFLVDAIKMEKENPALFIKFLNDFPEDILTNQTFKNREHLFGYDDYKHPDAFLTYFSQGLPKLVINEHKELNCTNSVHRLYLHSSFEDKQWIMKLIGIQLYCEFLRSEITLIARQYGNKIKKYEPSDAQKIPVFVPFLADETFIFELEKSFDDMVEKLSNNETAEAKKIGNKYLANIVLRASIPAFAS